MTGNYETHRLQLCVCDPRAYSILCSADMHASLSDLPETKIEASTILHKTKARNLMAQFVLSLLSHS